MEFKYKMRLNEEDGALPDEGYKESDCVKYKLQIRKTGWQDWRMEELEEITKSCFIKDTTKKHELTLHHKGW